MICVACGLLIFFHPKVSKLTDDEKVILPRPMKLEAMKRHSVRENACTICFDQIATVELHPCHHK